MFTTTVLLVSHDNSLLDAVTQVGRSVRNCEIESCTSIAEAMTVLSQRDVSLGLVHVAKPEDETVETLAKALKYPIDFFYGVEAGVDTFDCVSPTRLGRNGSFYTKNGRMIIKNAQFVDDHTPIDADCECYTCQHHTRAYLAHLFREDEMLGAALGSIHNLYFAVQLVARIRQSLLDGTYEELKEITLRDFYEK